MILHGLLGKCSLVLYSDKNAWALIQIIIILLTIKNNWW